MAILPRYAALSGMRGAIGDEVWARDRGDWATESYGDMGDLGLPSFLKKIGSGIATVGKTVAKGAVATGKFVAKTGVNAALNKVGLGPVFDTKGQALTVSESGQISVGPVKNYTPFIIGGAAVGVLALIVILRK